MRWSDCFSIVDHHSPSHNNLEVNDHPLKNNPFYNQLPFLGLNHIEQKRNSPSRLYEIISESKRTIYTCWVMHRVFSINFSINPLNLIHLCGQRITGLSKF